MIPKNISAGFKKLGLWPLNRYISEKEFLAASVSMNDGGPSASPDDGREMVGNLCPSSSTVMNVNQETQLAARPNHESNFEELTYQHPLLKWKAID